MRELTAALGRFEPFGVERLDGVGGARDELRRRPRRLEVGEHVVGERPPVAAARPADADPQAQEVLRAEVLDDRPQAVVAGEPAAEPGLEPAGLEVALVVDDEDRVGLDLEERPAALTERPDSFM